jgi:hypothetical protein
MAALGVPRGAAAQGSFEVGGSVGLNKAETDGGSSAFRPTLGASVEYSYTNRALDAGSGPIARLRFAYVHSTSDGGALTFGKVGLDEWTVPALSLGWRMKRLELGLTVDYRAEAYFLDAKASQAFEALHAPGHMRGQFYGPYVTLGLGVLGSTMEKVTVDACYQLGRGYRYGVFDYEGNLPDPDALDLDAPYSLRVRLTYAASTFVLLRAEYHDLSYPTVVRRNAGVVRPFDVDQRALFVSVALRQR